MCSVQVLVVVACVEVCSSECVGGQSSCKRRGSSKAPGIDNFRESTDFDSIGVAPSTTEYQSRCLNLMN